MFGCYLCRRPLRVITQVDFFPELAYRDKELEKWLRRDSRKVLTRMARAEARVHVHRKDGLMKGVAVEYSFRRDGTAEWERVENFSVNRDMIKEMVRHGRDCFERPNIRQRFSSELEVILMVRRLPTKSQWACVVAWYPRTRRVTERCDYAVVLLLLNRCNPGCCVCRDSASPTLDSRSTMTAAEPSVPMGTSASTQKGPAFTNLLRILVTGSRTYLL
jgi:hypothetical protein